MWYSKYCISKHLIVGSNHLESIKEKFFTKTCKKWEKYKSECEIILENSPPEPKMNSELMNSDTSTT